MVEGAAVEGVGGWEGGRVGVEEGRGYGRLEVGERASAVVENRTNANLGKG